MSRKIRRQRTRSRNGRNGGDVKGAMDQAPRTRLTRGMMMKKKIKVMGV